MKLIVEDIMYKYDEYHCCACMRDFPVDKAITVPDNNYRNVVHEKCPYCRNLDSLADLYNDL